MSDEHVDGVHRAASSVGTGETAWMPFLKVPPVQGEAIVIAMDIRGSSSILDQLSAGGRVSDYWKFMHALKEDLAALQVKASPLFDPYKFTGDGWILVMGANQPRGGELLRLLRSISECCEARLPSLLQRVDAPPAPDALGMTFGVDKGPICLGTVFQRREYIGRAINVACRLQGAVHEKKNATNYAALMSKAAYFDHAVPPTGFPVSATSRVLRNIAGDRPFDCFLVDLGNTEQK